jgi:hypothetical protein
MPHDDNKLPPFPPGQPIPPVGPARPAIPTLGQNVGGAFGNTTPTGLGGLLRDPALWQTIQQIAPLLMGTLGNPAMGAGAQQQFQQQEEIRRQQEEAAFKRRLLEQQTALQERQFNLQSVEFSDKRRKAGKEEALTTAERAAAANPNLTYQEHLDANPQDRGNLSPTDFAGIVAKTTRATELDDLQRQAHQSTINRANSAIDIDDFNKTTKQHEIDAAKVEAALLENPDAILTPQQMGVLSVADVEWRRAKFRRVGKEMGEDRTLAIRKEQADINAKDAQAAEAGARAILARTQADSLANENKLNPKEKLAFEVTDTLFARLEASKQTEEEYWKIHQNTRVRLGLAEAPDEPLPPEVKQSLTSRIVNFYLRNQIFPVDFPPSKTTSGTPGGASGGGGGGGFAPSPGDSQPPAAPPAAEPPKRQETITKISEALDTNFTIPPGAKASPEERSVASAANLLKKALQKYNEGFDKLEEFKGKTRIKGLKESVDEARDVFGGVFGSLQEEGRQNSITQLEARGERIQDVDLRNAFSFFVKNLRTGSVTPQQKAAMVQRLKNSRDPATQTLGNLLGATR